MPTYDYICSTCKGEVKDVFQKITDEALKICEKCHQQTLMRKPSAGIGLSFSSGGDGFYANMYGQNKKADDAPAAASKDSNACCPCGKAQSCSTKS